MRKKFWLTNHMIGAQNQDFVMTIMNTHAPQ